MKSREAYRIIQMNQNESNRPFLRSFQANLIIHRTHTQIVGEDSPQQERKRERDRSRLLADRRLCSKLIIERIFIRTLKIYDSLIKFAKKCSTLWRVHKLTFEGPLVVQVL